MNQDFEYAPGYHPPHIDLSIDVESAVALWTDRLAEVQRTGTFATVFGSKFFTDGNNYRWSQQDKEQYCQNMINQLTSSVTID
ncbi:MAG: hypothetical protein ABJG41_01455 [Cyclobacteriaceae bacterium]